MIADSGPGMQLIITIARFSQPHPRIVAIKPRCVLADFHGDKDDRKIYVLLERQPERKIERP
jgi:hypothetical protein